MPEECLSSSLSLPSELRFLSVARAYVEALCQAVRLSQPVTEAVVLAVHEAVSNVIRHAHRELPQAQFQITCSLGDENVEIVIVDEGEPFDVTAVPALNPAELRIGGRGVFLMRSLMDELSSARRAGRGNILRMVKRCGRNSRLQDCG